MRMSSRPSLDAGDHMPPRLPLPRARIFSGNLSSASCDRTNRPYPILVDPRWLAFHSEAQHTTRFSPTMADSKNHVPRGKVQAAGCGRRC